MFALPIYAIAAFVIVSGSSFATYRLTTLPLKVKAAEAEALISKQQTELAELKLKSEKVTTKIITKFVDKVRIVKVKGDTIIEKVPVYVTEKSDSNCVIPTGFVVLHDTSAKGNGNSIPNSTRDTNETPTDVKLSTVSNTVTENYTKYHEVAEQLTALQEWVKEQDNAFNTKK